ncbi:MAG TPA: GNAT family protein [Kineosporiaceae bacterium]
MSDEWPSSGKPWPVVLTEGALVLRPLRQRDARAWRAVRAVNADWLAPWEATHPDAGVPAPTFHQMVRAFAREARAGRMLPFAVDVDGRLVGQLTVSGIAWGSLRSGQIGYWVDRRVAGRGIIPTAVAMAVDHCFSIGLHRIEVNIRPENTASLRVVHKLGFRPEGLRRRFLHIDGAWRDHATFALTAEEVPEGFLPRWRRIAADLDAERSGVVSVSPPDSSATHR